MADGLREALSKFVPESVLDQAVDAVKTTEVAPEWYRKDIAEVGAKAKKADELEARLNSIESAPKRKEALKRVGIDYDAVPKYGQEALDSLPADKLDDLDYVAKYVNEKGFEADLSQQQPQPTSEAERITQATVDLGTGAPVRISQDARQQEFLAELDKVPDGDKNAMNEVLSKYGMTPATEG